MQQCKDTIELREWLLATSKGDVKVRRAQHGELSSVMKVLLEVSEWLRSRGIMQWPEDRFQEAEIRASIERGEVYLAQQNGISVGTLALQTSDAAIWGGVPGDALYLHRLAVSRSIAGAELGKHLMEWAERLAGDEGKTFLRLDCWAENAALRQYYERLGFQCKGEAKGLEGKGLYREGWRASLYEKRVR